VREKLLALVCLASLGGCSVTPHPNIQLPDPSTSGSPLESSPPTDADNRLTQVNVARIVDGDTVRVTMPDGSEERVRFIGVDTPERARPFFEEATDYTRSTLAGKSIFLEFDVTQRDRYGRLLAYVWTDSPASGSEAEIRTKMLNARLLLDGYAATMTVPPNVRYVELFRVFQQEARQKERGLWAG